MTAPDSPYDVQDVVDTLSQQIGSQALRIALLESKLKTSEARLESALADLTRLAPDAEPMVIDQAPEDATPRSRRST